MANCCKPALPPPFALAGLIFLAERQAGRLSASYHEALERVSYDDSIELVDQLLNGGGLDAGDDEDQGPDHPEGSAGS